MKLVGCCLYSYYLRMAGKNVNCCARRVTRFLSENLKKKMPGPGLSMKKRVDYQLSALRAFWSGKVAMSPTRFFGVVKSPCALQWTNGPCASADYKRQKDSARGRKIALAALSTLTPLEDSASLHLISLGSLKGAVSALTCCGSPLEVVEDMVQRRGLVSKLHLLLCVWQVFCHHISISEERFGD